MRLPWNQCGCVYKMKVDPASSPMFPTTMDGIWCGTDKKGNDSNNVWVACHLGGSVLCRCGNAHMPLPSGKSVLGPMPTSRGKAAVRSPDRRRFLRIACALPCALHASLITVS